MAPLTAVISGAVTSLVHLTTRQGFGPGDKTPQQYAKEGRYSYEPSFAAAVFFVALFAILAIANLFLIFRHRAWFWWSMNLAILMELVGYVTRTVSIKNLDGKITFILQTVFILVAPAVMAAACYQAFGRIVLWVVPKQFQTAGHLWLPARRITPLFVGCDVFSFFIQVIGGAMLAGADTPSRINTGKNVILLGLGVQMVTFGFFVLASIRLGVVLRGKLSMVQLPTERNWRLFLRVVNGASVIILIRTIARFIEFVAGTSSYMSTHEWYFYIFDATLMFLVAATFVVFHPGIFIPYLGMTRKYMQFSKNADSGFFSRFARGSHGIEIPSEYNVGDIR